jgi:hypothetical protein
VVKKRRTDKLNYFKNLAISLKTGPETVEP